MIKLSERQIAEYFYRSFTSVDGLWFIEGWNQDLYYRIFGMGHGIWKKYFF